MYYLVGLGNPGAEYANTRHNMGWIVLDYICTKFHVPSAILDKGVSGRVSSGRIGGVDVSVLYPGTFMNNSGSAVVKFVPPEDFNKLIVLYDDIDLPLGVVRISHGRGDGGHNGIKSIIDKTGTKDFIRIRIGIAKKTFWPWQQEVIKRPVGPALERFVLGKISTFEKKHLEEVQKQVEEVLTVILQYGYVTAMNRYN
ncbi:MAG: aminoacyl-tRNA hydrolase [Patescibacteria group bacterium]